MSAPRPVIRLGGWLFRHRGLLPVPWMMAAVWFCQPIGLTTVLGVGLIPLGMFIRLWASVHMGTGARVVEVGAEKLIYTGPYELSRNPLYLANMFIYTGVGLAGLGPVGGGVFFMVSALHYGFIVRFEEDFLQMRLGEIYRGYLNRVPRWFGESAPVHAAAPKGIMETRLTNAFRSERTTLMLGTLMIVALMMRAFLAG